MILHKRNEFYRRESFSDIDQIKDFRNGLKNNSAIKLYCPFFLGNNSTITKDYSNSKHNLTFNGNAKISTDNSYYNNKSSLYLDGVNSYISIADSEDWNFGNGDFTIKYKIYLNSLPVTHTAIGIFSLRNANNYINMVQSYIQNTNEFIFLNVRIDGNTVVNLWTQIPELQVNKWYNVTIARKGNYLFAYLDDILRCSYFYSSSFPNLINGPEIGRTYSWDNIRYFFGYIQDVIIVKGEAWDKHKFYDEDLDSKSSYLKAAWKFGNYGIYDCIGNNHLTNNGVTFTTDGLQGYKCASFNGSSYATSPNVSDLNFNANDSFSISFWIKTSATSRQIILSKNNTTSPYQGYFIHINDTGLTASIAFILTSTSGISKYAYTTATVNDNNWHFITCVVNKENNTSKIFVDAVEKHSVDITGLGDLTNTDSLYFGTRTVNLDLKYNGLLQEVIMHKGIYLTQDEISFLYNQGRAKLLQLETRKHAIEFNHDYLDSYKKYLVAGWNLNEMAGIRYDSIGHNHLTDVNSVGYIEDENFGRVANFNGSNYLKNDNIFNLQTPFTISVWFNPSNLTGYHCIYENDWNPSRVSYKFIIYTSNDDKYEIYHTDSSNNAAYTTFTILPNLQIGNWYNIVLTSDGSIIKCYHNGNQVGDWSRTGIYNQSYDMIYIGTDTLVSNQRFIGKIANFQIWNGVALDSNAISYLYNSGKGQKLNFVKNIEHSYSDGRIVPYYSNEQFVKQN